MARKALKKPVKRAAPKKLYAVAWNNAEWDPETKEFIGSEVFDTIQKAKEEAESSCDVGDTFYIYEVKLVAQSDRANKLTWKDCK